MPSTFLTLQIGYSALQDATLGVDTAGHNISNANTPGYARETVDSETANSLEQYTDHTSYLGEGVNGRSQLRVDDPSIDAQFRDNNAQQSYWDSTSSEINNIAQVFNEPSGTTLRSTIDSFFNSWNQLSQNPTDGGARAAVYEASKAVGEAFQTAASALNERNAAYQSQADSMATDFNNVLQNIADLNAQIQKATALSNSAGNVANQPAPNDLLDQRDADLDKLSKYAKIDVTRETDGTVTVSTDLNSGSALGTNVVLVQGNSVMSNVNTSLSAMASIPASGSTPGSVAIKDLLDKNGQLSSLYDMSQYIRNSDGKSGVLDKLDNLANEFVTQVNAQHEKGYGLDGSTGKDLFVATGTTASTIQVDTSYENNLNQLAAAASDTTGGQNQTDGGNAQAISGLLNTYEQTGAGVSYSGIVTQMGIDGQVATQKDQTFTALATQATNVRQSISGVDMNEEMKNMVQYQQAYGAASKLISVFDQMLTTLINEV